MESGLVGLSYIKGSLAGKSFTISRNELISKGQSFPGSTKPPNVKAPT